MSPAWRNAKASLTLVAEVDGRWPGRSKASDGTIGDAAHQSRESDHNPWVKDAAGVGVVRARDITAEGIDNLWLAEHLRLLGAAGDDRLNDGGYVIHRARIASERQGWAWRTYSGSNLHYHHLHVSLSRLATGYDAPGGWGIGKPPSGPKPPPASKQPTIRLGSSGQHVAYWQGVLNLVGGARLRVDSQFGPATEAATRRFQAFFRLKVDGIVGPATWALGLYCAALRR